ncbi:MAG: DUF2207 domain-containing protein [Alphaproteobacteria bacterium]
MAFKLKSFIFMVLFFLVFIAKTSNSQNFKEFGVPELSIPTYDDEQNKQTTDDEEKNQEQANSDTDETSIKASDNQEKSANSSEQKDNQDAENSSDEETEPEELTIYLPPNNTETSIPNFEHVPYFFSNIQLLPDGSAQVTETIKFVVKGNIIKNGISRLFPKITYNRMNQPIKGDIEIVAVYLDGVEEPFKIKKTKQGLLLITGNSKTPLKNGVHTYEISYAAYRQISMYNKFDEFFWNVTGANWNLGISRVGARIQLPMGARMLNRKAFVVLKDKETNDYIAFNDSENNVIFGTTKALGIGEGFVVLVSWPKGFVFEPDINQKITYFLKDNGDAVISFCGFIIIFFSYFMSWLFFKQKNKPKNLKVTKKLPQNINSAILRFLANGYFDAKSFVTCLLFMAHKNCLIIEEKEEKTFSLIKRGEKNRLLSKSELTLLEILFPNKKTILEINNKNALLVRNAMTELFSSFQNENKKLIFEQNKSYLFLSLSMFMIAFSAISILSIQPLYTFIISLSLSFLTLVTSFLLFSLFPIFLHNNDDSLKNRKSSIDDILTTNKDHLIKKIILFITMIIFGLGSYVGALLYMESTSLLATLFFVLTSFTISFFYGLFKNKDVLGTTLTNTILGYGKYLKNDGNVTPPLTKDIASKNINLFNIHLPCAVALDDEEIWCKKFMPKNDVDFKDLSYKPSWYSGTKQFNLEGLDKDLSNLILDLTKNISIISGI